MIQTLTGFNRPVSAKFNADGTKLYVVNRARGEVGVTRHEGSVSMVTVDKDGKMGRPNHRFVTRLTGPTDLAVSPISFGKIPRGAVFIVTGTPLIQTESGRITKDASQEFIGLVIADANTGQTLQRIDLSPKSKLKLQSAHSLVSPSSIEFDSKGNLYIGDTGIGGHLFQPRVQGKSRIWKIDRRGVMDLVAGISPTDVKPIGLTSLPGAMCYDSKSDSIFFITNHNQGAPSGSVFKVPAMSFTNMASMQTIVRELPALSGLKISPQGRVLMVSNSGELLLPKGRKDSREIRFRPPRRFTTPGKFGIATNSGGEVILAIPEEGSDAGVNKGQSLQVAKLSSEY
ncbi:MAG: hypothetical protein AAGB46_05880 [Verrucomicrobiota bacterium]